MSTTVTAPTGKVTINVPIEIDVQRLLDLMVSAIEGGASYWARFTVFERTAGLDYVEVHVHENADDWDSTLLGKKGKRVKAVDLARGIERLGHCATTKTMWDGTDAPEGGPSKNTVPFPAAPQHLANFLGENDDAETADVILQLTVFGTLVYS